MQSERKKLLMVFPPLAMPTSPPLGGAILKGFIEREAPDWQVVLLDLNKWYITRLLDGLAKGEFKLDPQFFPDTEEATSLLLEGSRAFRGQQQTGFHEKPDLYDRCAKVFFDFLEPHMTIMAQHSGSWRSVSPANQLMGEMLQMIINEKPDFLGMSMIFFTQHTIGAFLGEYLRTHAGLKVFFGGSLFYQNSERFLKSFPKAADVIVEGDGEEPLLQLLANDGKPDGIPGTTFLKDGKIVMNDPVFRKDIDYFGAPDFSGLDLDSYYSPEKLVPLLLSRGCYWRRCAFCVHHLSAGLTYRTHSIEMVIEMLRGYVDQGIRNFSFVDEMISPNYFSRLSHAIIETGLDISYYALAKPERGFTPDLLADMARSGCKYILWGVESGCQRVLDLIDKGTNVEGISLVLKNAYEAGIANHLYIICGFPTETAEEFTQTLRYLDDNKDHIHAVLAGLFSLEVGSKVFADQKRFGIEKSWIKYNTPLGDRLGYTSSSGMSMEEAEQIYEKSAIPFFRMFNPYSRYLALFRDHALLFYKRLGCKIEPNSRDFPKIENS